MSKLNVLVVSALATLAIVVTATSYATPAAPAPAAPAPLPATGGASSKTVITSAPDSAAAPSQARLTSVNGKTGSTHHTKKASVTKQHAHKKTQHHKA